MLRSAALVGCVASAAAFTANPVVLGRTQVGVRMCASKILTVATGRWLPPTWKRSLFRVFRSEMLGVRVTHPLCRTHHSPRMLVTPICRTGPGSGQVWLHAVSTRCRCASRRCLWPRFPAHPHGAQCRHHGRGQEVCEGSSRRRPEGQEGDFLVFRCALLVYLPSLHTQSNNTRYTPRTHT